MKRKFLRSTMKRFALFVLTALIAVSVALVTPSIVSAQASGYYSQYEAAKQAWGNGVRQVPDPDYIPVPLISKQFSQQELGRILVSLDVLNAAMGRHRPTADQIKACVQRYAKKDLDSPKTWSRAGGISGLWGNWGIAGNRGVSQRHRLYIDRMNENSTTLAQASVGINWRFFDRPYKDFRISLNTRNLTQDLSDDTRGISNIDIWASTIFHEILHNMGYDHADVINGNFSPVVGNLVYEAGWCVKRGGRERPPGDFGLTGNAAPRYLFVD